jgi:hypothetical protein
MKKLFTQFACISPFLFLLATVLISGITPGYNQASMTVSRLSIGAFGWLQSLNLIVFAAGLLIAAEQLTLNTGQPKTRLVLRRIFLISAITIILLAIFPTDPIDSFPKQIFTLSWRAVLHFILVGTYTLCTPISIAALIKTFRVDEDFREAIPFTVFVGYSAFTLSIIWFAFFYFGILNPYRGYFQKFIILEVFVWLVFVMIRLYRLGVQAKVRARHGVPALHEE